MWSFMYSKYSLPNIIRIINLRRMSLAGLVAGMGEKRNVCRLLVGKTEGKTTKTKMEVGE
jgi:hypothetical protein